MEAYFKKVPRNESPNDVTTKSSSSSRPKVDEPPSKRLKQEEVPDSGSEGSNEIPGRYKRRRDDPQSRDGLSEVEENRQTGHHAPDIETALPPVQVDEDAIQEYEAFKASQGSSTENNMADGGNERNPTWVKGRGSIYVDAFNLALDTVLEEESPLFNAKELDVFRQWRELDYEAQYLYVRLFLRKTASWHRTSRLSYGDIEDLEAAIESLQRTRELPPEGSCPGKGSGETPLEGIDMEEFTLSDTFTFADRSQDHLTSIEDAASLLLLEELKLLAKEAKVQGRNKSELIQALCRMAQQQTGLTALGFSKQNSRDSIKPMHLGKLRREDSNSQRHILSKILGVLGACIRLSPSVFKLFERVHLLFYRSTEWTEKSLTTIILAKIARRNFPEYLVCRTSTIFASRQHLVEFEAAIRLEADVDSILEFNGPPGDTGFQRILEIFEKVYPRWKALLVDEEQKERKVYDMGEGAYLRRFNPAHSYTRIIHKALYVFGRQKNHKREHALLSELLDQRLFHLARRGAWYQRKALLEEHYLAQLSQDTASPSLEVLKRRWNQTAVETCEKGLQDPDCHLIFHYDLQKRLVKLERKLRIPRRLQHDFGHVRLAEPKQITVEGIQLKREVATKPGRQASTKTLWLDELDSEGECSVEEMCLSYFRSVGWKGYHAEGGIVRTLFAYLFYDIIFLYIPNVFQTAYQTCPLDLHTDAFFPARASEINHRLVEIANGDGEMILRRVHAKEHERRTSVVGLNWDFELEDLAELVRCFEGSALAAICKVMAQEYKSRGGGIPDLILWRPAETLAEETAECHAGKAKGETMFVEVKSANDRLSDTQRLWIHVLTGAGVSVALCNAVAREVREVD
ncbi:VRR-NUC domain-containing protein [Stachybotrys elegans]|uniref:Fanconi-associated nuclease n=1 Tax=Stachybotrys elegans TaxID=80388 RepID=A0A8K0T681_9HYPO|nr:VRR-NUC domain-containing protein [Stachybotrys elegans]